MSASTQLDDFFPLPNAAALSKLSPRIWSGSTPSSTEAVREMLKDNHQKWHLFFLKDYRAHNHSMHWVLALWALGADEEILREAYKFDVKYLVSRYPSPGPITHENLHDHLGDQDYFDAYLEYFSNEVRTKGVVAALEEHVFDVKANFVPGKEADKQPEMLNRLMDGIIHSLIHVGHGLEFGLPGLVAEGLAWTAVHFTSSSKVMPASLWNTASTHPPPPTSPIGSLTSKFLGLGKKSSSATTSTTASDAQVHAAQPATSSDAKNIHALTILSRILKDSRFDNIVPADNYAVIYSNAAEPLGNAITEHAHAWSYDRNAPGEVERKIEELVWANAIIYACGGWGKSEEGFKADFFHVHLVTSSIFLPSIAAVISPENQELLLRSFFAVSLTWWIGHGRAKIDIPAFYAGTSVQQTSPLIDNSVPPHKEALPSPTSSKAFSPNPWLSILRDALVLPDEHLPKTIRALAHWDELLGRRSAGSFGSSQNEVKEVFNTELEGADKLDGTLFVRAAVLTMEKLEKDRDTDVSETKYWDREGFY